MNAQAPTPLWPRKRRLPRPHLPRPPKLDPQDRAALRKVGVYSISAVLVCVALTFLIVVVAFWIRLFLAIV